MQALECGITLSYKRLSLDFGAERIEMSTLTVRLTEREERDLQLACEQTGKANLQETLTKSHLRYKIHAIKQGAR